MGVVENHRQVAVEVGATHGGAQHPVGRDGAGEGMAVVVAEADSDQRDPRPRGGGPGRSLLGGPWCGTLTTSTGPTSPLASSCS